jgi:Tol biopolymer transport system component
VANRDGGDERPLLESADNSYNASYSYDGDWIVFTSERTGSADIWRVKPDGSDLTQLTDHPAFDDHAALSPDGHTLAFVSTRGEGNTNIWVQDINGGDAINITRSRSGNFRPSWSPDGAWIAFTSDRDTSPGRMVLGNGAASWEELQHTALYIMRPDGTDLRRLTALDAIAGSPSWSSDGRRIVYYSGTAFGEPTQIATIDVETGAITTHTSGDSRNIAPKFLVDGDIAYSRENNDYGPRRQTVLAYTSGGESVPIQAGSPAWSPDGALVVYDKFSRISTETQYGVDDRYELAVNTLPTAFPAFSTDGSRVAYSPGNTFGKTLFVADADGTNATEIFGTGTEGASIGSVAWSPDGETLTIELGGYFQRPIETTQIALLDVDGSNLRMLTNGSDSSGFPAFSPDGEHIVYRVLGKENGLRVVKLEDGSVTTLTDGWDNFPAWSPRGDLIAFTRYDNDSFEIYTIRPDGTELRQLTYTGGTDAHTVWSPDGEWLAFVSSRRGWKDEIMLRGPQTYGEIFIMRADGSEQIQLTDNQWEELTIAWLPAALGTE